MPIRLRAITTSDETWLWELHKTTMRPLVEQIWGWDDDVQRNFFREFIDIGDISILLVDDQPIGAIQLHRESDHLFLSQIEIAPEHQGKGYGSAIIRDLQTTASHPIRLQVLKVNEAAARLYRSLGFIDTSETATHFQMVWLPMVADRTT
jgi:ribosomal protein S18 acetylase RimI-like enzyme